MFSLKNSNFSGALSIGFMAQQTAVLATLAVGQTLIVLTAGVDLSVGTAMILVHLVMAKLAIDQNVPGILALMIGVAVAVLLGAIHGGFVTRGRVAAVHRHARNLLHLQFDRVGVQQGQDL